MKRKAIAFLMFTALCLSLLPVPALAAPSKGVWVLDKIEDLEARDLESTDNPALQDWIDYTYKRGAFSIDWRTKFDKYNSSGSLSAEFTKPPERVNPGETVTVSARFSSTATTDYQFDKLDLEYCYAYISVSDNAENILNHKNRYDIPRNTYLSAFKDSQSVSFTLPEGTLDKTARVQVALNNPTDAQWMITTYNYRYSSETAQITPSTAKNTRRAAKFHPVGWARTQRGGQADALDEAAGRGLLRNRYI